MYFQNQILSAEEFKKINRTNTLFVCCAKLDNAFLNRFRQGEGMVITGSVPVGHCTTNSYRHWYCWMGELLRQVAS